jgi:hypothetical protein
MDALKVLNESLGIYLKNLVAYVAAGFIAIAGSLLVITMPPLFFGLYSMAVKGVRGEKVEIKDVFNGFSFFARSWTYFIIIALLVLLPAVVFMLLSAVLIGSIIGVVGIILPIAAILLWVFALMVMTVYAIPLMVSGNLGTVDGIKSSMRTVKDNLGTTILLMVCLFAINLAVSLIPVIGMFLTRPFTAIVITKAALEARDGT